LQTSIFFIEAASSPNDCLRLTPVISSRFSSLSAAFADIYHDYLSPRPPDASSFFVRPSVYAELLCLRSPPASLSLSDISAGRCRQGWLARHCSSCFAALLSRSVPKFALFFMLLPPPVYMAPLRIYCPDFTVTITPHQSSFHRPLHHFAFSPLFIRSIYAHGATELIIITRIRTLLHRAVT